MSVIAFMLSERQQRMLGALLLYPYRDRVPGYGAGRHILDQFEKSGIVLKSARGNQRLYSVNSRHPIPDLRSICFKTFGISEVIAKELAPFRCRFPRSVRLKRIEKSYRSLGPGWWQLQLRRIGPARLYWLSKDPYETAFKEVAEPDAEGLRETTSNTSIESQNARLKLA